MNKVNKVVLENGLTLLHSQVDRAEVVSLVVWVKAGSAAETSTEYGIAHMCEHNVFKGTKRRAVGQISAEAEFAGGDINAWTSYDETAFYITLPSQHAELGMDLLADMLQNATIDPEELEREKEVILEEYRRGQDSPMQKLSQVTFSATYGSHPYGHDIIGTEESIKAQTSATLHHFMAKHYVPQNMIVTVVGKISLSEARELTEKYWGTWQPEVICREHGAKAEETIALPTSPKINILREKLEECFYSLTWLSPSCDHEDIPALDILDVILGGSASCRLSTRLRDKLNLVNNISTFNFTPQSQGIFVLCGSLEASKLATSLKETMATIKELVDKGVTAEEVAKARFILQSDTWRKQETAEGLARDWVNQEALFGDPNYELIYNTLLEEVTPEKIRATAIKYLQNPACINIVAPEKSDLPSEEEIRKLCKLEIAPKSASHLQMTTDENNWLVYNLPGGGRMVAQVDHSAPIVACSISYNGGQRYEVKGQSGIDSFLAKMLTFSTKKHSFKELNTKFDELAAGVNGSGGRNSIGIQGTFLAKNFQEGLPLLLECLWQPAFKRLDIMLVRRLILEKIRTASDRPATRAKEAALKLLYQGHSLGNPALGLPEDIKNISGGDLKARHKQIILQNEPHISIVGDFDPDQTCQTIIDAYRSLCKKTKKLPAIPEVQALNEPREITIPADKEQTHIYLAFLGPNMSDARERWALTLLCAAIGGMSGRLFMQLRDVESLCYTVSGMYITGPLCGHIAFYIATAPEKTTQAKEGLKRELQKILTDGITEKELEKAKNSILGENVTSMQYMETRALNISLDSAYGLPYNSYLSLSNDLQKITIADIQGTAKKYLDWDRAVWATVGDAK